MSVVAEYVIPQSKLLRPIGAQVNLGQLAIEAGMFEKDLVGLKNGQQLQKLAQLTPDMIAANFSLLTGHDLKVSYSFFVGLFEGVATADDFDAGLIHLAYANPTTQLSLAEAFAEIRRRSRPKAAKPPAAEKKSWLTGIWGG